MSVTRLEHIIGHEQAIECLRRDIGSGRVPDTYLFAGPAGVGKSTVAELVATAMLCITEDEAVKPCGECSSCKKTQRSNHPDFHKVELESGKRQIRIDQVRELQAKIALRPYEAEWKTVIIDRAEALNEASQNALLKTLEEPPGKTLLILVAPSPQSLLPTIVSRSRIERFGPLKRNELARLLTEQKDMDEEEARLVAGLAGGSVGKALNMDMEFVRETRPELIRSLAELAVADNPGAEMVLGAVDMIMDAGEDGLDTIGNWLKDVAWRKMGLKEMTHPDLGEYTDRVARKWEMDGVVTRFQAVVRAREGIVKNLHKALTYENLLMEML